MFDTRKKTGPAPKIGVLRQVWMDLTAHREPRPDDDKDPRKQSMLVNPALSLRELACRREGATGRNWF